MINEADKVRSDWIYKISGFAAILAGILLAIELVVLILQTIKLNPAGAWVNSIQDNWLILIFKLHAGYSGITIDALQGLRAVDVVILSLVCLTYVGLFLTLYPASKVLTVIACIQPFLGLILLLVTKSVGRSTVMGAGLVISFVMWRCNNFKKSLAVMGMISSLFLLLGDLTAGDTPSILIADLFGIGYLLVIAWFIFTGITLLQKCAEE